MHSNAGLHLARPGRVAHSINVLSPFLLPLRLLFFHSIASPLECLHGEKVRIMVLKMLQPRLLPLYRRPLRVWLPGSFHHRAYTPYTRIVESDDRFRVHACHERAGWSHSAVICRVRYPPSLLGKSRGIVGCSSASFATNGDDNSFKKEEEQQERNVYVKSGGIGLAMGVFGGVCGLGGGVIAIPMLSAMGLSQHQVW